VPELSRAQLAVYAAIAVVALLLGARWIKSGDAGAPAESIAYGNGGSAGEQVEFEATGGDVVVHVAGAVRNPGVYRMPEGSRVTDAIDRAGGATPDAAEDAINLAARVADGQQIHVPGRSQAPAGVAGSPVIGVGGVPDGPISLGSATVEQLDTIEGIGPVTAAGIIEFRDQSGGVASIDELDQISGIGPATMEALRARLQP
jgi:competence protein ComEA